MPDNENFEVQRGFSGVDAKRAFVILALAAVVGLSYWFLLPVIQSLILPTAVGGENGPWVVRPILAFRFGAAAVMTAVTAPLIMLPLQRVWNREDRDLGSRYVPFLGRRVTFAFALIQGSLLLVVYTAALVFYLYSWELIGPDGIEERLPWTTRTHSFEDIESLETIPEGARSDSLTQNGPWYSIKFKNGLHLTFDEGNEGITNDELRAIAAYISDRSGIDWVRRSDARAR